MNNKILSDKKLRDTIKVTTETLVKIVKSTLGPSGTNVGVTNTLLLPIIINDGVTVAKKISFEDPFQNYIANLLKTVSQNTDNIAKDGTTTSLTLTEAIIVEGLKNIELGFSQIDIAKGIRLATLDVLKELESRKIPLKDNIEILKQVASISANNDIELGSLIADAFSKVGVDGQIEVKDSQTDTTYVDIIDGMKYDSGYISNMFNNTKSNSVHFENCKVLLYEGRLLDITPLTETLKNIREQDIPLLIVADDFSKEVEEDLVYNKLNGGFKLCAVKSPGYGISKEQNIDDIALISGAKVISKRLGTKIEDFKIDFLGEVSDIKVRSEDFTLINTKADKKAIAKKIKSLKDDLKKEQNAKTEINNRIASLSNGVAIIYVQGDSSVEISDKKYRIEDAIGSTRASLEQGIIAGGGVTLFNIGNTLKIPIMDNKAQEAGYNILRNALKSPITTICLNVGEKPDVILHTIENNSNIINYGFDAKSKKFGDMIEMGIIDPVKVTVTALVNASSVSQMILTMNAVVL
ncbi:MAG: chaperonin GroEL [Flavobacteriaceae bacterium]|jgi:chaperonin GroEL